MDTDSDELVISPSSEDSPKKYIRTLSGDMMTLQKGGIPNLELLKEKQKETPLGEYLTTPSGTKGKEKLVADMTVDMSAELPQVPSSPQFSRLPQVPVPPTPPLPPVPLPSASERLIEASPIVDLPPLPPIPPVSLKMDRIEQFAMVSKPSEVVSNPLKTYVNDFRDRMKEKNASAMTVLAAEQDAGPVSLIGQIDTNSPEESSQKGQWFVIVGIILFIISGVAVYVAYQKYGGTLAPVIITPTESAPIFIDSRSNISGSSVDLIRAIKENSLDPLPTNTVRLLSIATTSAPNKNNILTILNARAPGLLMRNIDSSGGMIGIVNTNGGQSPFFILSVSSYSATFSGMLSWETTIFNDLGTLFPFSTSSPSTVPPFIPKTISASTTATTTVAKTSPQVTPTPSKTATTSKVALKVGFRDEVVSNHDVRVYRDASNKSLIIYGYWDQKTLIIARDPAGFAEILARLATAHTSR
jgi:hypothetical protein